MVVSGLLGMQQGLVQPRGSFWHADEFVHAAVVTRNSSDCVHTLNNRSGVLSVHHLLPRSVPM
jgi:hypothetical protein